MLFLFGLATIEAIAFPLPVEPFLIPFLLGAPGRWKSYVAVVWAGSVLGAAIGFALAFWLFEQWGAPLIAFYGYADKFAQFESWYATYGIGAVFIGGVSPIPFKLVVLASGALAYPFVPFLLAAAVARLLRYGIFGLLCAKFGPALMPLVDRVMIWLLLGVCLTLGGLWYWL